VRVPHVPPVHYIRHLHARVQLVGLHLHRKRWRLRSLHIRQHLRGISISGRGARSSKRKTFHSQPRSANCAANAAAIGSVTAVE